MTVMFNYIFVNSYTLLCFIYWAIPNNILLFLAEQISYMQFYDVQDVYQKNQLGTRLDKRQKWCQE